MGKLGVRCIKPLPLVGILIFPLLAVSQTININPRYPLYNSSVAIADLDSDGFQEIIFVSTSFICRSEDGTSSVTKKTASRKVADPTDRLPGFLYVHALDGATNYTTELSPNHDGLNTSWPRVRRA